MRRDRFFCSRIEGSFAFLEGEELHHLSKVLRYRVGEEVSVFDGKGNEYVCVIEELSREEAKLRILRKVESREYSKFVAVGQAIMKHSRWDWFLEKATELGVKEIVPLITQRTVVKPKASKERWYRIVLSACKQSGRQLVPEVKEIMTLERFVMYSKDFDTKLLLDPYAKRCISEVELGERILIAVGPEGGFSEDEIDLLKRYGFVGTKLGNFILRSETAPIVALSQIVCRL